MIKIILLKQVFFMTGVYCTRLVFITICRDLRVQINLISDFFALHKTPFSDFECIEKHIFSGISDYSDFSHRCSHTPAFANVNITLKILQDTSVTTCSIDTKLHRGCVGGVGICLDYCLTVFPVLKIMSFEVAYFSSRSLK